MAASRSEPSLLTAVLRIFSDRIGAGSAWTVEEIWQALRDGNRWREYDFEFDYYWHRRGARDFDTPQQWLTAVLQTLAELGLVALDDSPEESSGFQRWRIGDSWRPPEPPGGDGGGGNVGPTADGGDNDDGGGGLREALGHPVLLALPQDDFDELVNGLFGEVQP
jgi:hypothetical protein